MLPTTAQICKDRCADLNDRADIEKVIEELQGKLYDGGLDPDNNLDNEPLGFFEFPDGSKAGVRGSIDPKSCEPQWGVWEKGENRV